MGKILGTYELVAGVEKTVLQTTDSLIIKASCINIVNKDSADSTFSLAICNDPEDIQNSEWFFFNEDILGSESFPIYLKDNGGDTLEMETGQAVVVKAANSLTVVQVTA